MASAGSFYAPSRATVESDPVREVGRQVLGFGGAHGSGGDGGRELPDSAAVRMRELIERGRKRVAASVAVVDPQAALIADRVRDRVLTKRYRHTLSELQQHRVCLRCGVTYRRADSIGAWQCRAHPGRVIDGLHNCCNRPEFPIPPIAREGDGCRRADHSDELPRREGIEAWLVDDAELAALLDPLPEARREVRGRIDGDRWLGGGPIIPLVSALDVPSSSAASAPIIRDDIREHDVMAVPRARPLRPDRHIDHPYRIDDDDDDGGDGEGDKNKGAAKGPSGHKNRPDHYRSCLILTCDPMLRR